MRVVVVPVVVSLLVPEHEGPGSSSYAALTSGGGLVHGQVTLIITIILC